MSRARGILAAAAVLAGVAGVARASSPMHPDVPLLDGEGKPVLESGRPVSPTRTCGACHDAEAIAAHGYHAWAGFDERTAVGKTPGGRPWDVSPGTFGRWDPATYRRLSVEGDTAFDLGVAEWIRTVGRRHVGGGPALVREDGQRHGAPGGLPRETSVLDPRTGRAVPWDWAASGAPEMNCFLCHVASPADAERVAALARGAFGWAATATLAATGLVEADGHGGFRYRKDRFSSAGEAPRERLGISNPAAAHCGACHLDVTEGPALVGREGTWSPRDPGAMGQVFSPQRVRDSALNLRGKESRTGAWDVHAERLLDCADCHHAMNNPARFSEAEGSRPAHLAYDARRLGLGEYLKRPSHDFTKGRSSRAHAGAAVDGSMRRCEGCHDALATHGAWLPSARRHVQALLCEACHVPEVPVPAVEQTDWTVLLPGGRPVLTHRGTEGPIDDPATLLTGYEPVLLPRREADGSERLAPHHLGTAWYWTGGEPRRPVRLRDLEAALFDEKGEDRPEVVRALDADADGVLAPEERRLDTAAKVEVVRGRLVAAGVADPRIEGSIEPTGLHHGVAGPGLATKSCRACHARDSRMSRPFELAAYVPHGATASLAPGGTVRLAGRVETTKDGRLFYRPEPKAAGRYVLGHDRAGWVDYVGVLAFTGTLLAALLHAGLRWAAARRRKEA